MSTYFSTFIVGLSDVVQTALLSTIPDSKVLESYDGLIIYQTTAPIEKIRKLRFFNNSFLLYQKFGNLPFKEMIKSVLVSCHPGRLGRYRPVTSLDPGSSKYFRVVFSQENKMVSVNPATLEQVEEYLHQETDFLVNRSKPDVEFWFLKRSEGFGLFGQRLTYHPDYADILEPGELRPELAYLLCLLSDPQPDDVFLDPFAGSGAIPLERARSFPAKKIIASDINLAKVKKIERKVKDENLNVKVLKSDTTNLSEIATGSITKIVTDPPWGLYNKTVNLKNLYTRMLKEFSRVLTKDGSVILLVSNQALLQKILTLSPRFKLLMTHQVSLSGKTAVFYILRKAC